MLRATLSCAATLCALAACDLGDAPSTARQAAIADVAARENRFPDYPRAGRTYLSFSQAHGFQVNYLASSGRAWLWYPGNSAALPELYTRDVVNGRQALCWQHPAASYNPVTGQRGGAVACTPLEFAQRTIVAVLPGDPFGLASGAVPYRLDRCTAPTAFKFDRAAFRC